MMLAHIGLDGSIPACAGETARRPISADSAKVYPRVCGGNTLKRALAYRNRGLSPRVRGKPGSSRCPTAGKRSIPACAGETRHRGLWRGSGEVYPRVCGGNPVPHQERNGRWGLSPRVRGKHHGLHHRQDALRSIPACAGETIGCCAESPCFGVYPRVCGGNQPQTRNGRHQLGLSPRVRGKRVRVCRVIFKRRSIPACAGETPAFPRYAGVVEVYPRVCGGNPRYRNLFGCGDGLSPRVRGKLRAIRAGGLDTRSIPACAGETLRKGAEGNFYEVYPRVCGGNGYGAQRPAPSAGLSPRVRGKHRAARVDELLKRSIPACAGETRPRAAGRSGASVYPRVCGGNQPARTHLWI